MYCLSYSMYNKLICGIEWKHVLEIFRGIIDRILVLKLQLKLQAQRFHLFGSTFPTWFAWSKVHHSQSTQMHTVGLAEMKKLNQTWILWVSPQVVVEMIDELLQM